MSGPWPQSRTMSRALASRVLCECMTHFGRPRRARGEGQIDDAVRIGAGRAGIDSGLRKILRRVDHPQRCDARQDRLEVDARAIGAPAGLGDERAGAQPLEQRADLGAGEGAVQRRVAGEPSARAGQERDDGLGAVRHPDRDAVAAARGRARDRSAATPSTQRRARPTSAPAARPAARWRCRARPHAAPAARETCRGATSPARSSDGRRPDDAASGTGAPRHPSRPTGLCSAQSMQSLAMPASRCRCELPPIRAYWRQNRRRRPRPPPHFERRRENMRFTRQLAHSSGLLNSAGARILPTQAWLVGTGPFRYRRRETVRSIVLGLAESVRGGGPQAEKGGLACLRNGKRKSGRRTSGTAVRSRAAASSATARPAPEHSARPCWCRRHGWQPSARPSPTRSARMQPLSGAAAAGGKTALVGLQMAVDRINKLRRHQRPAGRADRGRRRVQARRRPPQDREARGRGQRRRACGRLPLQHLPRLHAGVRGGQDRQHDQRVPRHHADHHQVQPLHASGRSTMRPPRPWLSRPIS